MNKDNLNKVVDFESSVSMYDVEDKKLVVVFRSLSVAYEYLFNKSAPQGKDTSTKLKRWVEGKKRKVFLIELFVLDGQTQNRRNCYKINKL